MFVDGGSLLRHVANRVHKWLTNLDLCRKGFVSTFSMEFDNIKEDPKEVRPWLAKLRVEHLVGLITGQSFDLEGS